MPARKLPPNSELQKFLRRGMTYEAIADHLQSQGIDVTSQAVSVAISRAGLADRRPTYADWIPWKINAEHMQTYPALMLRAYARYVASDNDWDALRPDQRVRLRNWLAMLEESNKVVNYNPERGFYLVPRHPGEEIIRKPGPRCKWVRDAWKAQQQAEAG
jgi:hypothetical protein